MARLEHEQLLPAVELLWQVVDVPGRYAPEHLMSQDPLQDLQIRCCLLQ